MISSFYVQHSRGQWAYLLLLLALAMYTFHHEKGKIDYGCRRFIQIYSNMNTQNEEEIREDV